MITKINKKKGKILIGSLAMVLCLLPSHTFNSISVLAATGTSPDKLLICTNPNVFLYSSSDLTGDVIGMLEEGDSAFIQESTDSYFKIVSGGYSGYVAKNGLTRGKEALKKCAEYCDKQVTVTSDTAFLNSASDMSGTVLALYSKGQTLEYLDDGSGWVSVKDANDIEGFLQSRSVSTKYVYTYAKEPDLELYCELYPEKSLSCYGSNKEYDAVHGTNANTEMVSEENNILSDIGQQVCEYAKQFVGNPYVWGGESLKDGCDCSGFIMLVYRHFGIQLPHSSFEIRKYGSLVCEGMDEKKMQPGDIICYNGHVSLYLGHGKVISAASEKYGIRISDISYRTDYICVRRLVSGSSERVISLSELDKSVLYRIVEAEAGGQDFIGKMYIANVVINRMLDSRFPDTIEKVVSAPGQFSPYTNGRYESVSISEETIKAVSYAVSHNDNSHGALYFLNPDISDPVNINWFDSSLEYLFTYGGHAFYK